MKIMFYINTIHKGGAERVLANLANYLDSVGHTVFVVTSIKETFEYKLNPNVSRFIMEEYKRNSSTIIRNISRIYKLRQYCRQEAVDVLISFMGEPNFRAIVATMGLKVKKIISVRNDPNKEYAGKIMNIIGKYLLPLADGCIFQTEEAKEWFPEKLQRKSQVIFNAVDPNFYQSEHKNICNNIITMGRLEKQKNHELLIMAFAKIYKQFPEINLEIYGSGSLKAHLQKLIDDNHLSKRVFLKGHINDVKGILSTAKLFVLSSDYEGMPNALMEAMAVGLPIISTDCPCGGPRALVGDDLKDCLFPVGDVRALAYKISNILQDDILYKKNSIAVKKKAEQFNPKIVYKVWEKFIYNVVEQK